VGVVVVGGNPVSVLAPVVAGVASCPGRVSTAGGLGAEGAG